MFFVRPKSRTACLLETLFSCQQQIIVLGIAVLLHFKIFLFQRDFDVGIIFKQLVTTPDIIIS